MAREMAASNAADTGTMSEASLSRLPPAILNIIATKLNKQGLASMRAMCRGLRDGSSFEFYQRYTTSEVELLTHGNHLRCSTVVVRSQDLPKARAAMAQALVLHKHVVIHENDAGKGKDPRTFMSNPNDFTLLQQTKYKLWDESSLTQPVFERLATLSPQTAVLSKLVILNAYLDGDTVIKVLETHGQTLRFVSFDSVALTNFVECIRALHHTEAQVLELRSLKVCGEVEGGPMSWKDAAFCGLRYLAYLKWNMSPCVIVDGIYCERNVLTRARVRKWKGG